MFKTDWTTHLHWIRTEEIKRVFEHFGLAKFNRGLEIGCGDGYQTTLLAPRFRSFVASDLNFKRIKDTLKLPNVEYAQYDADALTGVFNDREFDFIFSSNVLEHLSQPRGFLMATRHALKDEGYAVHVVPSRFVKLSYILLYYLDLGVLVSDRIIGLLHGRKIFRGGAISLENNIHSVREERKSRLRRFVFPQIHGNFKSHIEEFRKFGRKEWERMFSECGYKVVKHIKGPVFSGYGFGFNTIRRILTFFGWSSEHIFIIQKSTTSIL